MPSPRRTRTLPWHKTGSCLARESVAFIDYGIVHKKGQHHSKAGSIRLILLLVGITTGVLWLGLQRLYTTVTNLRPTVMSYDAYIQSKPKAVWLMLTNCLLDLNDCACKRAFADGAAELYVPVRSCNPSQERVHVLLATRNPELIATFKERQKLSSGAELLAWELGNSERLFPKRDIRGLVHSHGSDSQKQRAKLGRLQTLVASDFIILDHDARPSFAAGLALTAAGLALLLACLVYYRRSREPVGDAKGRPRPAAPATVHWLTGAS